MDSGIGQSRIRGYGRGGGTRTMVLSVSGSAFPERPRRRIAWLHWSNNLALRQYLRKLPDACRRYLEAKRQAVTMGATTLVAYSRAKRLMGETLLAEALSDTRNTENDS